MADALSPWVMTYDPDAATIDLVGPFDTAAAATAWGERWQAENDDSPCWQLLGGAPSVHLVVPEAPC